MFGCDVVWAATTKDADYIRMEGMKRLISDDIHRKEIVAGGMWEYLLSGKTSLRATQYQWFSNPA